MLNIFYLVPTNIYYIFLFFIFLINGLNSLEIKIWTFVYPTQNLISLVSLQAMVEKFFFLNNNHPSLMLYCKLKTNLMWFGFKSLLIILSSCSFKVLNLWFYYKRTIWENFQWRLLLNKYSFLFYLNVALSRKVR